MGKPVSTLVGIDDTQPTPVSQWRAELFPSSFHSPLPVHTSHNQNINYVTFVFFHFLLQYIICTPAINAFFPLTFHCSSQSNHLPNFTSTISALANPSSLSLSLHFHLQFRFNSKIQTHHRPLKETTGGAALFLTLPSFSLLLLSLLFRSIHPSCHSFSFCSIFAFFNFLINFCSNYEFFPSSFAGYISAVAAICIEFYF